jgi:apolipoprotein N-acyltransferase
MVRSGPAEGASSDTLVLTDAARQRQSLYQATVMAPFLDFTPLSELLPVSVRGRIHDAGRRPGQHGAMFELARVPFGVMVGWDDISGPEVRRQLDGQDPEWLLSVVDDRTFVGTPLPEYHHACAVFRAIEQGRFLVRVAAEGGSALIDPLGAVRLRSAVGEPFTQLVETPRLHAATGYQAMGNFATPLCLLFALSLVLLRPARQLSEGSETDARAEVG